MLVRLQQGMPGVGLPSQPRAEHSRVDAEALREIDGGHGRGHGPSLAGSVAGRSKPDPDRGAGAGGRSQERGTLHHCPSHFDASLKPVVGELIARSDQVGRAGELFVAAEIHRRGGYAVTFSSNMPGIDILASDATHTRRITIQVKTKRAA